MKFLKSFYLFLSVCAITNSFGQQFYYLPKQIFNPYQVLGYADKKYIKNENETRNFSMTIDSFSISNQITFSEYKTYLIQIKKDSSAQFYLSQLPDSNITTQKKNTI